MRLIHYSDKPFTVMQSVEQIAPRSYFDKPRGLWVSVEGEDDWRSWCAAENFGLGRLTHVHDVVFADEARVLRINSANGIDTLTEQYGCKPCDYLPNCAGIDWQRVAANFQGVIIAPYIWERRLSMDVQWYYGWDCASGCIWDAAAVKSITLTEVVSA